MTTAMQRIAFGPQPAADNFLALQPLAAKWDVKQGTFHWHAANETTLTADLPFGQCRLEFSADERDEQLVRVACTLRIDEPVNLHTLEIRYRPTFGQPARWYVPYLRPGKKMVIADQMYRSPVIIAQQDDRYIALLPDLHNWPTDEKTYLDFLYDAGDGGCRLTHGLGPWKTSGHVFFHKTNRWKPLARGAEMRFGHYLLLASPTPASFYGRAASLLWERFARRDDPRPQMLPLVEYERLAVERIFAPDLHHEFTYHDRPVGGMITQTVTARRQPGLMNAKELAGYLRQQDRLIKMMRLIQVTLFTNRLGYYLLTETIHTGRMKALPMISFACWFNQVRTALGARLHAEEIGDRALADKCTRIVELFLNAPRDNGLPPAVCLFPDGEVSWKNGTRAFAMSDDFHLPDAAVTAFHLLEWHEHVAADERIPALCRSLAERLLTLQDEAGAFPSWIKASGEVDPTLAQSAAAAAPAMLLARLHRLFPEPKYAQAAERALRFIQREVLPEDKWFDYELLLSCAGRPTGQDGPEPFTRAYPANSLSMYWAAYACLDLHKADGNDDLLRLGREILDRLSLFQQVVDHPRLSFDTFGGFGVMNADAEFNDARQGLFVPLYLEYHRITGDPELYARGAATLRACFTSMLTPENEPVAAGNLIRYRPSDRGAILENYGHTGRDEPSGGYLSPDWGCGTSLYGSGLARRLAGPEIDPLRTPKEDQ